MRRLLILIVFLLAALLLLVPGLVGFGIQQAYPDAVAGLEERLTDYRVESAAFDRGWFASELSLRAAPDSGPGLDLSSDLRQGPLTVWPPAWAAGTAMLRRDQELLAVADFRVTPALQLKASARPAPEVGGGVLEIDLTEGGDQLRAEARSLSVRDLVDDATGTLFAHIDGEQLQSLAMDLRAAGVSPGPGRRVDQPVLSLDGRREGDNLGLELDFEAKGLRFDGRDLAEPRLELSLRRLHAPTVLQLARAVRDLLARSPAGQLPALELQNTLVTSLGPLLLHQPEVDLALSGESSLGEFAVDARARLQQRPPANFIRDFSLLLKVLQLEMTAHFDRRLLETWARRQIMQEYPGIEDPVVLEEMQRQYIANLENNAVIVPTGEDSYEMKLDYTPGRAVLNGQAMSLPDDWTGM